MCPTVCFSFVHDSSFYCTLLSCAGHQAFGLFHPPANVVPGAKYPTILQVYAGPVVQVSSKSMYTTVVASEIPKNHSRLYKRSLQPPKPCSAVASRHAPCTNSCVDTVVDRTTAFQYSTAGLRVIFRNFIGHDCSNAFKISFEVSRSFITRSRF